MPDLQTDEQQADAMMTQAAIRIRQELEILDSIFARPNLPTRN
jgi:hypothetical protein